MEDHLSNFILKAFPTLATPALGLPAWYWVSIVLCLIAALIFAGVFKRPVAKVIAVLARPKLHNERELFVDKLSGPIFVFLALVLFLFFSTFVQEPQKADETLSVAKSLALFLSFTYLFYRTIDFIFASLIRRNINPKSRVFLVLPLGRRVGKSLLVVMSFLFLLAHFGIDVSALLLGLGVGGLAIALAAQKILENLFGGVVLSLDQPFQVGDFCKCGDMFGFIEEIGVRSTKIRTRDRTLIRIPNSKLADLSIENFTEREKVRFLAIFKLDFSSKPSSMRQLRDDFEALILSDDDFYDEDYRVRLAGLGDFCFEMEVFCYAKTTKFSEFVVMRENLLFKMLEKIEERGLKMAMPRVKNIVSVKDLGNI